MSNKIEKTTDQQFFSELGLLLKKYGAKIEADTYRLCAMAQIKIRNTSRENKEPYMNFSFTPGICKEISEGKFK